MDKDIKHRIAHEMKMCAKALGISLILGVCTLVVYSIVNKPPMEDAESLGKTKKAIEQIRQRQETSEQLCRQTQETIKQFQYQLESESG